MAVIGISLIVASVIWVIVRPPGWTPAWFRQWWTNTPRSGIAPASTTTEAQAKPPPASNGEKKTSTKADTESMPPPPPPMIIQPPTIEPPIEDEKADEDGQSTPKASAAQPAQPVPSFSLQPDEATPSPSTRPPNGMMPPPPLPAASRRLPAFPAVNSPQRARGPLPNRNPTAASSALGAGSALAPPPTHTSKPSKPNRKVILTPGHSPLDWARISGPTADLRGVPSGSSYIRVTPSMLKKMNGRKGKDAWMGLNGKVYNISPYADYHPGGVPELLRGAGKDGTKLFGEVHPWVNYETMLSACLIGLMVEEPEGNKESEMDQMD